jgi:broad specificity phosphatase PhoE
MSFIHLIRHGQASADKEDYDQLSELGELQSQRLQKALQGKHIAAVYVGPRKRHLQTYQAAYQDDWPMAIQANWLDEFPAIELITHGAEQLCQLVPEFAPILEARKDQVGIVGADYARVLKKATQLWINGLLSPPEVESFEAYEARLKIARGSLIQPREGAVLCFSSAGWVASFVGLIQIADAAQAIRSAWALYNASITTLKLTEDGPFLAALNGIEHIPEHERTFL